ncbi:unannotated protein [freshwater metagenome]|uniref:Unannotated protein n=1 Tax=freshwater metagenome TaxID=449393 RepID=A0A6J6M3X2_9ZZZZ
MTSAFLPAISGRKKRSPTADPSAYGPKKSDARPAVAFNRPAFDSVSNDRHKSERTFPFRPVATNGSD